MTLTMPIDNGRKMSVQKQRVPLLLDTNLPPTLPLAISCVVIPGSSIHFAIIANKECI